MSGFSKLDLVSDFLAPSGACVNPLFVSPPKAPTSATSQEANGSTSTIKQRGIVTLDADSYEADVYSLPTLLPLSTSATSSSSSSSSISSSESRQGTARVTLNDCLACSGCVTSAETVLINELSTGAFLAALERRKRKRLQPLQGLEILLKHENGKSVISPDQDDDVVIDDGDADDDLECVFLSLSPQSIASIFVYFGDCFESLSDAYKAIRMAMYSIGVDSVVDTQVALDLALCEEGEELYGRILQQHFGDGGVTINTNDTKSIVIGNNDGRVNINKEERVRAPIVSIPYSATHIGVPQQIDASTASSSSVSPTYSVIYDPPTFSSSSSSSSLIHQSLPVLSSACPGFVCYVEKTVPESVQYLSRVKSPQQLTGALSKILLSTGKVTSFGRGRGGGGGGGGDARSLSFHPLSHVSSSSSSSSSSSPPPSIHKIFHCAIMPCYDKKLEATRKEFYWERDSLLQAVLETADVSEAEAIGETKSTKSSSSSGGGGGGVREVDCVLAVTELIELLLTLPAFQNYFQKKNRTSVTFSTTDLQSNEKENSTKPDIENWFHRGGLLFHHQEPSLSELTIFPPPPPSSSSSIILPASMPAILLDDLFCCLSNDGKSLCGGLPTDNESDGHLAFLVRYIAKAFGGGQIVSSSSLSPSSIGKIKGVITSSSSDSSSSDQSLALTDPFIPLPLEKGRNSDMRELTLLVSMPPSLKHYDGVDEKNNNDDANTCTPLSSPSSSRVQIPLVFAAAYGFRNIQGVISKMKRYQSSNNRIGREGSSLTSSSSSSYSSSPPPPPPFAYVEVMACPSGCVNGGGLPKKQNDQDGKNSTNSSSKSSSTSSLLKNVRESLLRSPTGNYSQYSDPTITRKRLFALLPELDELSSPSSSSSPTTRRGWRWLTRTRFHILPKLEDGLTEKW